MAVAGDEGVSDETRMLAAQALSRAAAAPAPAAIRKIERDALSEPRENMDPAEIRRLASEAASQAQQVSILMARLADLLGASPDGAHGR